MYENAFPYQFLLDLNSLSRGQTLPNALKELLKQLDIKDCRKLEEALALDLQNAPLGNQKDQDYYMFIAKQALLYSFYRRDTEGFKFVMDIVRHRSNSLKNVQHASMNHEGWEAYLDLIMISFDRQIRKTSIDNFEKHISAIEWQKIDEALISDVSSLIGYVYLNENNKDQVNKSKIWLDKALRESNPEHKLSVYFFLIAFHIQQEGTDIPQKLQDLIHELPEIRDSMDTPIGQKIYDYAIYELETSVVNGTFSKNYDSKQLMLEDRQQRLREVESQFHQVRENLPSFTQARILSFVGSLYRQLYGMTNDNLEQASFSKHAVEKIEKAIEISEERKDENAAMKYKLQKSVAMYETGRNLTEKDLKETVQFYRRNQDYPLYIEAAKSYVDHVRLNGNPQKSYDLISNILKQGSKKIEEGGANLIISGLKLANQVFLIEAKEPGVSWMVEILDEFFDKVAEIIDSIEENLEFYSKSQIDELLSIYTDLEPASHFSIRAYFKYQLYELKSLRVTALVNKDAIALRLSEQLLKTFQNKDNPLSFIQGDWKEGEFKDVPNSVRNKTINKCINISKGDLPLAAEHLNFSYRNLRSYITFKEVNRLGFFLSMQLTNNKQLEQGIRYMFYDLYKAGTIFEVVFDMPKFLVENAQDGFFAQDLEQKLNIKGTTAKKYIKIMIEKGIIRQDKATGRKHFYRLIRENVMNRLGKEQAMMIRSV
ncbi:MAG: hypothetical protein AAFY45_16255 [Bacteroidota bacterium]